MHESRFSAFTKLLRYSLVTNPLFSDRVCFEYSLWPVAQLKAFWIRQMPPMSEQTL